MPTFIDVPTTHAFYDEIEWVAAQGILRGWASGYFRPGSTMTSSRSRMEQRSGSEASSSRS